MCMALEYYKKYLVGSSLSIMKLKFRRSIVFLQLQFIFICVMKINEKYCDEFNKRKFELKSQTVENHTFEEFTLIKIIFEFCILLSLEYCFSKINYKIYYIML